MFKPFRLFGGATIVRIALGAVAAAPASAAEVVVYTIQSIAVNAPDEATVVNLDTAAAIEAELSAELPTDPARAVAVARERLRQGGNDLQRSLASAYEQIAEAWSLGVATLPAVVVDRRYVVYGETDLAKAIARIEAYRSLRP